MENQSEKKENLFKVLSILLPVGFFYILGIVNIVKERKHDGTFLDTLGPYIGYACILFATLVLIIFLYKWLKGNKK